MTDISRFAEFVYLMVGVVVVLFLAIAVPPFQVPDEPHHFFRAVQISDGRLLDTPAAGRDSGGMIDANAVGFVHESFQNYRKGGRVSRETIERSAGFRWGGPQVYTPFPGSSVYPPLTYLPQVVAIWTGKIFDVSISNTFHFGRILNGLIAVFMSFLAIRWCRTGKPLMFSLLALPMTLFQFASLSQDAVLIGACALLVALASRSYVDTRPIRGWEYALILALLVTVATARLPYALLAALLFLGPLTLYEGPVPIYTPRDRLTMLAGVAVASALWVVPAAMTYHDTRVAGVSPSGQLAFLLGTPSAVFDVVVNTLPTFASLKRQMVGVLGWLEISFPKGFYTLAQAVLVASLVATMAENTAVQIRDRWLAAAALCLSLGAFLGIFYLSWTPVGETRVQGMQGRYLIGILPLLGISLAGLLPRWHMAERILWFPILLFPFVSWSYLVSTIITYYYLPGG